MKGPKTVNKTKKEAATRVKHKRLGQRKHRPTFLPHIAGRPGAGKGSGTPRQDDDNNNSFTSSIISLLARDAIYCRQQSSSSLELAYRNTYSHISAQHI